MDASPPAVLSLWSDGEEPQPDSTVFLGSPSADDAQVAGIVAGVRRGCDAAVAAAEQRWLIRVRDGDSAPSAEPSTIRDHVRREIVDHADAAIFVLTAASFGCGRETAWAIALGVPVLLLVDPADERRPHMGPTSWETRVTVRFIDGGEAACDEVAAWLTEQRPVIQTGGRRRTRPQNETEALRLAAIRCWKESPSQERDRLARATHTTREHLHALLSSASEFAAARAGLVLGLTHQMGVWSPVTLAAATAQLDDESWAALGEAIDTWDWDGVTVAHAVEAGLHVVREAAVLVAAGDRQRAPNLRDKFGWRTVMLRRGHAR